MKIKNFREDKNVKILPKKQLKNVQGRGIIEDVGGLSIVEENGDFIIEDDSDFLVSIIEDLDGL